MSRVRNGMDMAGGAHVREDDDGNHCHGNAQGRVLRPRVPPGTWTQARCDCSCQPTGALDSGKDGDVYQITKALIRQLGI